MMGARLLVVEDREMDRKLAKIQLRRYSVDLAENFRVATQYLASTRYDGVLLDLKLPDIGVDTVVRAIKALLPRTTALIIWTGYDDINIARKAKEESACLVIVKGIDDTSQKSLEDAIESGFALNAASCKIAETRKEIQTNGLDGDDI